MQKKIIALAVAGLVSGAAFAQSNVTIYGQMNASYDNVSTNAPGQDTLNRVSSNSSRLGFKGEEKLGSGISAVFQIENAINLDAGATTTLATRNTFIGLKGGFGTALAGNHDTPYKLSTGSLDPFADTIADANNIISSSNGTNVRDLRLGNVLAYISPTWSGFHAAIATSMLNESGNAALSNPKAWSMTGIYSNGPLFLSLAWEKQTTAEVLAAAAVVEPKVEVLQFQRRRAAQLVVPGDARVADDDAFLREQPVVFFTLIPQRRARIRNDHCSLKRINVTFFKKLGR